jgi:hypothetical protein
VDAPNGRDAPSGKSEQIVRKSPNALDRRIDQNGLDGQNARSVFGAIAPWVQAQRVGLKCAEVSSELSLVESCRNDRRYSRPSCRSLPRARRRPLTHRI